MQPKFSFAVIPELDLVTIEMSGFFQPADVRKFEEARDDAHRQLICGPNRHRTLVDMREMLIQSQDSVAEFQRVLSNPSTRSRKLAIVVSKTLARMQIQRAAEQRDVKYFADGTEEARTWLLAD